MKYLNLTEGFNPFNAKGEDLIKFESFFFTGGEPHIKIQEYEKDDVQITSRLKSNDDFIMLMVAVDALYGLGIHKEVYLFIPYFPGARQDRINVKGEPLTCKVFADILNNCDFNLVQVYDVHSDVTLAVLENSESITNHKFVAHCISLICNEDQVDLDDIVLVSPDAGSNKKINKLAYSEEVSGFPVIKCDKKSRDVTNGNINGIEVYANDLEGKTCIIVDDLIDVGKTFTETAKELKKKNAGDIYLVVSHGIFSKPLSELSSYFKRIYTTDSWGSEFHWEQVERDTTDLVEIVKFKDFM